MTAHGWIEVVTVLVLPSILVAIGVLLAGVEIVRAVASRETVERWGGDASRDRARARLHEVRGTDERSRMRAMREAS